MGVALSGSGFACGEAYGAGHARVAANTAHALMDVATDAGGTLGVLDGLVLGASGCAGRCGQDPARW